MSMVSHPTIPLVLYEQTTFHYIMVGIMEYWCITSILNFNTKDKPLVHCLKIANVSQVFVDPDCDKPIRDTESQIAEELPNTKIHYIDELALFDRLRLKSTPKHRAKDSTRRPQDTDSSACALIYIWYHWFT